MLKSKSILIRLLSLVFLLIFVISIFGFVVNITSSRNNRNYFFKTHEISREPLRILTPSKVFISADLYLPKNASNANEGSIPTIIIIPGANAQKDRHIHMHLQFAMQGYAVLAMEQRGHGLSGGSATFYREEPRDVIAVMDYLETKYEFLNCTDFGLVGMSYGGGTALWAQALDPRIHSTVVYHPIANLSSLLDDAPIEWLIGFKPEFPTDPPLEFGQKPDWNSYLASLWANFSAINYVNSQNTENMLILHGDQDGTIPLSSSQILYEKLIENANPLTTNIHFVIRPGLGHGGNERDRVSLQYTLTWFNHFYFNSSNSIDFIGMNDELNLLSTFEYPEIKDYSGWVYGIIIGGFGCLWLISFPQFIGEFKKSISQSEKPFNQNYPSSHKTGIIRVTIFFSGIIFALILHFFVNPGLLWTWLIFPALFQLVGYILIPMRTNSDKQQKYSYFSLISNEWHSYLSKENLKSYLQSLVLVIGPLLIGSILIELAGIATFSEVLPITTTSSFWYSILLLLPLLSGLSFLRDLPKKYWIVYWLISSIGYGILISIRVFVLSSYVPMIHPIILGWVAGFILSILFLIMMMCCYGIGKIIRHKTIPVLLFGLILALFLVPSLRFY